ncbi:MAG: 3D domain-containing protein [Candidatus Hydrogenedentes bacterium]|nr:3D domain-containing protein [Candidatus Hydrogenedentota bacterium]
MIAVPRRLARLVLVAALLVAAGAGCSRFRPPKKVTPVQRTMTTTGYCKCRKCCGWRRTWYGRAVYAYGPNKGKHKRVGVTASGTKAKPGTIAADPARYPFGTIMYVPGYGYGRVEDRGSAIQGEHIDLFFKSHAEALAWGTQKKEVAVWFPRGSP